MRAYRHRPAGKLATTEPLAIIYGNVEGLASVPIRVHDACFTSEVRAILKKVSARQTVAELVSLSNALSVKFFEPL